MERKLGSEGSHCDARLVSEKEGIHWQMNLCVFFLGTVRQSNLGVLSRASVKVS